MRCVAESGLNPEVWGSVIPSWSKRKAVPVQRVPTTAEPFPDLAWLEVSQTCPFFPLGFSVPGRPEEGLLG